MGKSQARSMFQAQGTAYAKNEMWEASSQPVGYHLQLSLLCLSLIHHSPSLSVGTGAPSWRPQKNRSRAASGGAALASPSPGSGSGPPAGSGGKERSENLSLRRSVSELSLQGRRRRQQERRQQALSMAPGAADAQIGPVDPGDFDQLTQCLIQAPSNRPYFLLLQGYQDAQVGTSSSTGRVLCRILRLKGDKTTTPRIPWVVLVFGMPESTVPARSQGRRYCQRREWGRWRWLRGISLEGQVGDDLFRSKLGESTVFLQEECESVF